jgi:predicted nucleotidyltransferase
MAQNTEIIAIENVLKKLRREGKVLIAILYGSYANGVPHKRSDIDLALYIRAKDNKEDMKISDEILMAVERDVSILRLDDEEESPFVIQEALKGVHLVEADLETLYEIGNRVLHECEEIRFRREVKIG